MKRNKIIQIFILCSIIITTSISFAWFTDKDIKTSSFIGSVKISNIEDFTPPENWDGASYTKNVVIKSIGKSDSLVRVSLVPRWIDKHENPFSGDTSIVKFTPENPRNWINGNDGYYYYNKILKSGESTTALLEEVSLDLTNLSEEEKNLYEDKQLIVDVNSECIQATEEAFNSAWTTLSQGIKTTLEGLCSK